MSLERRETHTPTRPNKRTRIRQACNRCRDRKGKVRKGELPSIDVFWF